MTQAAKQCRKYIEANYPDTRISRLACRDTAYGGISQHSAFQHYDSNAMDLMGPSEMSPEEQRAFIQVIVDDLLLHSTEWSIRKILWKVTDHYGHAHVDFYPMITIHKWCGGPEIPVWRYSDGSIIKTRDPEPENGLYEGRTDMPKQQWHQLIDSLFLGRPDEFHGDPDYWKQLDPNSPEWMDFWAAFVRVIG